MATAQAVAKLRTLVVPSVDFEPLFTQRTVGYAVGGDQS